MQYGAIGGLIMGLLTAVILSAKARRQERLKISPVPAAVDVPVGHGVLIVRHRADGTHPAKGSFEVIVDDVAHGQVDGHAGVAIPLPPGTHSVRIGRRKATSPVRTFAVQPGGSITYDYTFVTAPSRSIAIQLVNE